MRILFVCHGNICRSPMAELIMKKLAAESGVEIEVDSFATSMEEQGNQIYPPAVRVLAAHGISGSHRAKVLTRLDYERADMLFVMDRNNLRNAMRITGNDPEGKIRLLLENKEIDDPWYTDDFEKAYSDIEKGCAVILKSLM